MYILLLRRRKQIQHKESAFFINTFTWTSPAFIYGECNGILQGIFQQFLDVQFIWNFAQGFNPLRHKEITILLCKNPTRIKKHTYA